MKKLTLIVAALLVMMFTMQGLFADGIGMLEFDLLSFRYSLVKNNGVDNPYGSLGVSLNAAWRIPVAKNIFVGPSLRFESSIYDENRQFNGFKFGADVAWNFKTVGKAYPVSLCLEGGVGAYMASTQNVGTLIYPMFRGGFSAIFTVPAEDDYGIKVKAFVSVDNCLQKDTSIYSFSAGIGITIKLDDKEPNVFTRGKDIREVPREIPEEPKKEVRIPEGTVPIQVERTKLPNQDDGLNEFAVIQDPNIVQGNEPETGVEKVVVEEKPFTGRIVYIRVDKTLDTSSLENMDFAIQ